MGLRPTCEILTHVTAFDRCSNEVRIWKALLTFMEDLSQSHRTGDSTVNWSGSNWRIWLCINWCGERRLSDSSPLDFTSDAWPLLKVVLTHQCRKAMSKGWIYYIVKSQNPKYDRYLEALLIRDKRRPMRQQSTNIKISTKVFSLSQNSARHTNASSYPDGFGFRTTTIANCVNSKIPEARSIFSITT